MQTAGRGVQTSREHVIFARSRPDPADGIYQRPLVGFRLLVLLLKLTAPIGPEFALFDDSVATQRGA